MAKKKPFKFKLPSDKVPRVIIENNVQICPVCRKIMSSWRYKKRKHLFCSHKCANVWNGLARVGKKYRMRGDWPITGQIS